MVKRSLQLCNLGYQLRCGQTSRMGYRYKNWGRGKGQEEMTFGSHRDSCPTHFMATHNWVGHCNIHPNEWQLQGPLSPENSVR
jgi:hypothetical protein